MMGSAGHKKAEVCVTGYFSGKGSAQFEINRSNMEGDLERRSGRAWCLVLRAASSSLELKATT